MGSYDVLCIGDAKLDAFLTLSETSKVRLDENTEELCIKHGEKIPVEHTKFAVGGNAANVAVGLSRLGIKATIAAEIGDDEFSLKIINTLAKEHIDRGFIRQDQNRESSFSIAISYKNDRTLFSEHFKRDHDFRYEGVETKWIYLTSLGEEWTHAYEKAINYAAEQQAQIAFNPGTLQLTDKSAATESALRASNILFINKEEAKRLIYGYSNEYNSDDIQQILSNVKALGPKTVVITDGENGSYALDNDNNFYHQDPSPSNPVELTGAGDSYATGFLAATIHGLGIQDAMAWGSTNAASVVEQIGAQDGLLRKDEMEEKINAHR